MIQLNLIPQQDKKYYKMEITRRFVIFFGIGTFILAVIFIGLLLSGYFFLSLQLNPEIQRLETEKATEKFRKVEDFDNQIKETNKKIGLILNIKNQATPISPIIEKILQVSSGDDSYLENITIDRQTGNISIKGFSLTRNQVVKIEDSIKKEDLFKDVIAPYSNLLKQRNINFSFDFKIDTKNNP